MTLQRDGETVASALRTMVAQFSASGLDSAALDARRLLSAASGLDAVTVLTCPEFRLASDDLERIEKFKRLRLAHVPVSRIIGRREFYGRSFNVSPDVLDPRPETETLVDQTLELADAAGGRAWPFRILDIGTGSGALLLTLLAELPNATGLGTDVCAKALAAARANADALGLLDRARFAQRRSLVDVVGTFDFIVSNPPYIATGDIERLAPEVRDQDPRIALDGGVDGLCVYREIAECLEDHVADGWVVLEVASNQAEEVSRIIRQRSTICEIRLRADLGSHIRCVAGRLQSASSREKQLDS